MLSKKCKCLSQEITVQYQMSKKQNRAIHQSRVEEQVQNAREYRGLIEQETQIARVKKNTIQIQFSIDSRAKSEGQVLFKVLDGSLLKRGAQVSGAELIAG